MDKHVPVLLKEAVSFLQVRPGVRFIDATVGGGGHSEVILREGGVVLGIDQDPTAIVISQKRLSACSGAYQTVHPQDAFVLVQGNFSHLQKIASENGFKKVDGILFDLGFASFQIDNPVRGLSFSQDGPLDMRLDPSLGVTAADLVNALSESQLHDLLKDVGDEPRARAIAKAIVDARKNKNFSTTGELKKLIEGRFGAQKVGNVHPATRTFMALRIAVNLELENLRQALPLAVNLLNPGGRLVIISFHSGEDRIVKNFFRSEVRNLKILTSKPVRPAEQEIRNNPRARSACLRIAERI